MHVRRERKFTINLGNYESFSFGASVEMSHNDLGKTDEDVRTLSDDEFSTMVAELEQAVADCLTNLIVEDITTAKTMTTEKKSALTAIFAHYANTNRK